MSSTVGASGVTLSVEFAGVCLFVVDREPKTSVSVLVPTCVPTTGVGTQHEDGDVGARHVPYLLIDLANLDLGQTVTPGLVADGPRFQVVRRLSREEISFGSEAPQDSIVLDPDPLPVPDLSQYKKKGMELKELLASILPNESPELNVRTTLNGGTLAGITLGGPGNVGGPAVEKSDWDKDPEDWAGSIRWTRPIPEGSLTISIHNWDTKETTPITLSPAPGRNVIELKIANLCEDNPLEWREFEERLNKDDVDFKWLYRLFRAESGGNLLDVFGGRGHKFPYPKLAPRRARTTGNTGCTPGQFNRGG